VQATRQRE
jgi:hypothetical protein